jgi:hypothetical protein
VDRVVWLAPDPAQLRLLNRQYAGIAIPWSHDHLGHAFSAYFLGWASARTRYVAHVDSDLLLWQQPGYSWLRAAVAALQADDNLLAASPRIAPSPSDHDTMVRVEAPRSGWSPTWPLTVAAGGWTSPWFSTRCHLLDRERLAKVLPLSCRRTLRRDAAFNRALAPLFRCAALTGASRSGLACRLMARVPHFPLPPEVLLHECAQRRGFRCLYLRDPRAWIIHPDSKPPHFTTVLPRLLWHVTRRGECPAAQRGVGGLDYAAWDSFLASTGGS